jgi:TolB-like protein
MEEVELLVMTFYDFAERQRQEALASGMSHDD